MTKALRYFAYLFIPLTFVMGIFLISAPITATRAEESSQTEVTETAYNSLWLNELAGVPYKSSATIDARTGNWSSVSNGGGIAYTDVDPNTEVKMVLKFSSVGRINFCMRATGDGTYAAPGGSAWESKGYWVRVYKNKQYEFYKNGTKMNESNWPEATYLNNNGLAVDQAYTFVFRTINLSDGSVKISLTRDGHKYFEYIDKEEPILTGNAFAISNVDGSAFSSSGNEEFSQDVVKLGDLATPTLLNGGNFGVAKLNEDGSVTTTATSANPAGVAYSYQQNNLHAVQTKFKPSAVSGKLIVSVGSKNGTHAMNRPDVTGEWGWADTGYVATWKADGSASIVRNGETLVSCGADANYAFEAGKEYSVSMGVYKLSTGRNRVWLKVDGKTYCVAVDRDDTQLSLPKGSNSTQPATLVRTSLVLANGVEATISSDKTSYEEKTLASIDLSSPIGGSATYDRNGTPVKFGTGIAIVYGNVGSSSIKFKANFTSAGYLIFQSRAQGTIDTPWGAGWTNKGYYVYVYANGQAILSKNGKAICQGFGLTSSGFTTGKDYLFEIKTINLGTTATLVQVLCEGKSIINFTDFDEPILTAGTFQIFSDGTAGAISMVGYEKPTITTSAIESEIEVGQEVELSYSISDKKQEDVVTYHIDATATTAEATLEGNVLTATTVGEIALYTCVNGFYSDNITLVVEAEPIVTVTNLPTMPIIVGGETYTVGGEIDKGEVLTKVFSIENLTGKATINAETGEITAIAAGNVNVYVSINGTKSQAYLVAISPKIEVKNTNALALGEVRTLGYEANCVLPEETITTTYQLVEGENLAVLDEMTGVISAKGYGIVVVRVIVTGTTFQGVSPAVQIAIEAPVVVLHGIKDMYVGQTITANPVINEGVAIASKELVVVSGEDVITIDGDKITAIKAGLARVKAVINGYESKVLEIVANELTATLIASTMTINDSQKLSILLNFEEVEITSIKYSIEEGELFARIEEDVLYSNSKKGDVHIKAVVMIGDKKLEVQEVVSIVGEVRLANISNDTTLLVGAKLQLGYKYFGNDEVDTVEYVLIEGKNIANLSKEGVLEARGTGIIKLKVIVNGKESDVISVRIEKLKFANTTGNENLILIIIIVGSTVVAAAVATVVTLLILKKKKLIGGGNKQGKKQTKDKGEE